VPAAQQICQNFVRGRCPNGAECRRIHDDALRKAFLDDTRAKKAAKADAAKAAIVIPKLMSRSSSPPPAAASSAAPPTILARSPQEQRASRGAALGQASRALGPPPLLLDSALRVVASEKLQAALHPANCEFAVVGVLGLQGAGKSALMSLLYDGSAEQQRPRFAVHEDGGLAGAAHVTAGVHAAVTAERLVLLDTQPLLSPAMWLAGLASGRPPPGGAASWEQAVEAQSALLAAFVLSVCHTVVVVGDRPAGGAADAELADVLRAAQLLRTGVPPMGGAMAAAVAAADGDAAAGDTLRRPRSADLVLVSNKAAGEHLGESSSSAGGGAHLPAHFPAVDAAAVLGESGGAEGAGGAARAPHFVIPWSGSCSANGGALREDDAAGARHFRRAVLGRRQQRFGASAGLPISEQEWLRESILIWEHLSASAGVADYQAGSSGGGGGGGGGGGSGGGGSGGGGSSGSGGRKSTPNSRAGRQ
jgi:hypothetical protein